MIVKPCYFDAAITILPEENSIIFETEKKHSKLHSKRYRAHNRVLRV